jgi:hypothetical protein
VRAALLAYGVEYFAYQRAVPGHVSERHLPCSWRVGGQAFWESCEMLEMIEGTLFLLLLVYGSLAPTVPIAERMLLGQGPLLRTLAVATLASG